MSCVERAAKAAYMRFAIKQRGGLDGFSAPAGGAALYSDPLKTTVSRA